MLRKIDNRYQIIKELGSGFSGEVLLVEDDEGQKALKFLKQIQLNVSREQALENFRSEFTILSELNHPGIARILDFGYDTYLNKYYFTTELINGTDFFKGTEGKSVEEVEDLAVQILRALNYLHSRGIYHLDIKPQNVLVQVKDGKLEAKLIDFGLAGLDKSGKLIGTPAYMAPEIIVGERPDGRTDIYSFGVVLYKALTRMNPFANRDLRETLNRQQTITPQHPSEIKKEIPEYWDRIIMRMLEKKPSNRYAQASFALRDFNFLANKHYEIETADTKRSYLLEKGRLIGRRKELEIFKNLFELTFSHDQPSPTRLVIVEGKAGTGKSRLISEFKYISQLHYVPVFNWKQFKEEKPPSPFILVIDEKPSPSPDQINLVLQQIANEKTLVIWSTEEAPTGWTNCEKLTLNSFAEQEVRDYLMMVTGLTDTPQKLVKEIFRRTQGNPLFVTELLKTLLEKNLILDSGGRWMSHTFEDIGIDFDKIKVPVTVSELLYQHYQSLNAEEKTLLEWMALAARPVSLAELTALSELPKPQAVLLTLIRADMIERGTEGGYTIRNILLNDTILESLPAEEKAGMHDVLAGFLANRPEEKRRMLFHRGRGQDDGAAIAALTELADEQLQSGKPAAAIEALDLAAMRSESKDVYTRLETEMKLAEALIRGAQYKRAITHYSHIRDTIESSPQFNMGEEQKADIWVKMGDLYTKLDAFNEAIALFDKALLQLGEDQAHRVKRMVIENYRANGLRMAGRVDEAEAVYLKNFEIWDKEFTDADKKKVTNNRLAETLALKKEYDLALRQIERDLDFFESLGDNVLKARTWYIKGDLYYRIMFTTDAQARLHAEEQAMEAFERTITLAKPIEAHDLILRSYNGIGNIYFERKNYVKSADYYQRALMLARKLEDIRTAAILSLNLGGIYHKQKQHHDAYSHYVFAINTYENMENKNSWNWIHLFQSYLELAETQRETNDLMKAEESLNRAGSLVRSLPHLSPYEFHIALEKAKLSHKKGNKEACRDYLNKARQLAKEGEDMQDLSSFETELKNAPEPAKAGDGNAVISSAGDPVALEGILKINQMINSEHDPAHLMKMVLHYALELTGAESGVVLLLNEEGDFNPVASINTANDIDAAKISTHVARKAIETGEAVLVADALTDDRFGESASVVINDLKSILCLPIHSQNKAIGVFYLDNRVKVNAFKDINMKLIAAFCDQVGIAIQNAKLIDAYKKASHELEEKLSKTSEELHEVKEHLKSENSVYRTRYSYAQILSKSKPMREIFKILDKVTETNLTVYLHGASGTGKELIARALHYNCPQRSGKRFVAINCGAIPANLIESELFGYKAGSFTGATKDKKGLIEEAEGGTLFLDEIGDLDMTLQVKLLRFLQEGEIHRVGDTRTIKVDVRIVCASHKSIEDMVKTQTFREDLFFRLCQLKINLPPLIDRREDVPVLAEHFIEKFCKENGVEGKLKLSPSFLKALLQYDWPGNVRELENLMSVACALRDGTELSISSLPPNYRFVHELKGPAAGAQATGSVGKHVAINAENNYDSTKTWAQYESVILAKCLLANDFKKVAAADMLDISHSTLYKKIKELGLEDKNHPLYRESFVYMPGMKLADYIPLIFAAALEYSDDHPYTAIRWLQVSQGYFYKIIKLKQNTSVG